MICRKCGMHLDQDAKFCSYCGAEALIDYAGKTPTKSTVHKYKLPIVIGALVVAAILGFFAFSSSQDSGSGKGNGNSDGVIIDGDNQQESGKYIMTKEIRVNPSDPTTYYSYIEYVYDSNILLVQEKEYNEDGEYTGDKGWYSYDDDGHLIESKTYEYGQIDDWYYYTYSPDGELTGETRWRSDGSFFSTSEYEDGRLKKVIFYDNVGGIRYYNDYTYTNEGNLLSRYKYDPDGYWIDYEEYTYNADGNPISYISKSDKENKNTDYEYDESGRLISETTHTERFMSDNTKRLEYYYDDNGDPLEIREYNEYGSLVSRYSTVVDDNGRTIEITEYSSKGDVKQRESLEYDENGNVISDRFVGDLITQSYWFEYTYDQYGNMTTKKMLYSDGTVNDWYEYEYQLTKDYIPPEN